jgi:hypothetical protein
VNSTRSRASTLAFAVGMGSLAMGALAVLVDCSVDNGGQGSVGDAGNDATNAMDAANAADATNPTDTKNTTDATDVTMTADTTTDEGAPDVAVTDAREAASESGSCLRCNGTCIDASDCTSCSAAPVMCGPTSTCVASCLQCNDGGAGSQCDCADGGVSACHSDTQVCAVLGLSYRCFECDEMTAAPIDGRPCRNGRICNVAAHTCQ